MITTYQRDVYLMRSGQLTGHKMSFPEIALATGRSAHACSSTYWAAKKKIDAGQGDIIGVARVISSSKSDEADSLSDIDKVQDEVDSGLRCHVCWLLFTNRSDCTPAKCAARTDPFDYHIQGLANLFRAIDDPDSYMKKPKEETGNLPIPQTRDPVEFDIDNEVFGDFANTILDGSSW